MVNKNYYALTQENNEATINIYGDITSWTYFEEDVSSYTLSKQLEALDVDTINVYINSYGGEVAEGLAIYNSLKRHKAKIITHCDGFACSIASVIFMAGDERIMSSASLLMIHNAWTWAAGNANDFRKQANDLDVITQASVNAYMSEINITEEELKELLDNETWISPQDAVEKGFASAVINEKNTNKASQSVKKSLMKMIFNRTLQSEKSEVNEQEEPEVNDPDENEQSEEPKQNKLGSFFNALIK